MGGSMTHSPPPPPPPPPLQQQQQQRRKITIFAKACDSRVPATPRTLEKSTSQKESLANLFADLNITPGPFYAQKVKAGQKDCALQSAKIRRLSQNLMQRKQRMKSFTNNGMFVDIFKGVPRSKEDEEQRQMLETALSSSPVELVARELIDKTANIQNRERQGVWSQLGKPYTCLGVPASALSKDCPMPKETRNLVDDEEHSFPFFPSASRSIPAHALVENMERPISGAKTDPELDFSQAGYSMQWLL